MAGNEGTYKQLDSIPPEEFESVIKKLKGEIKKGEFAFFYTPGGVRVKINTEMAKETKFVEIVKFIISNAIPLRVVSEGVEFQNLFENKANSKAYIQALDSLIEECQLDEVYFEGNLATTAFIEDLNWSIVVKEQASATNIKNPYKTAVIKITVTDAVNINFKKPVDFEIGKHRLGKIIEELKEIQKKLE